MAGAGRENSNGALWHAKQCIAIDTVIFVYYLEWQNPPSVLQNFFSALQKGKVIGVASSVVLTELYTLPLRQEDYGLLDRHREFLAQLRPNLSFYAVTTGIAEQAALIRAKYNFSTPDAIHLATALEYQADFFLSNDRKLQRFSATPVKVLKDYM